MEQSFSLKLFCRSILSTIWRRRRLFFIFIFLFCFASEKGEKFPYVSFFTGNMDVCLNGWNIYQQSTLFHLIPAFSASSLEKEMNPTAIVMYVIEKLICQMESSTLELDLNYKLSAYNSGIDSTYIKCSLFPSSSSNCFYFGEQCRIYTVCG